MPTSGKNHWSSVEPGQEFTTVLEYDPKIYKPATVEVKLRRDAETGCTESAVSLLRR